MIRAIRVKMANAEEEITEVPAFRHGKSAAPRRPVRCLVSPDRHLLYDSNPVWIASRWPTRRSLPIAECH